MEHSTRTDSKTKIRVLVLSVMVILLGLTGCATKGAKPDDMSVAEHRAAAENLRQDAKYHDGLYRPGYYVRQSFGDFEDLGYSDDTYNPTEVHRDTADNYRSMAHDHEKAAESLESFETAQCGDFPSDTRKLCPLMGTIDRIETITDGVRIFFKTEHLPLNAVFDHMKCHNAYGRTLDYEGMPMCPLYLEHIRIEKSENGKAVEVTADDPDTVQAIRKRTRAHLAPGSAHHDH